MALGLFKKKDVPDELPSIDERRKEHKKEEKLAPDELSPINRSRLEKIEKPKEEDYSEEPEKTEEDSELYFTKVMKKLSEQDVKKSEDVINAKSGSIINTLDSYWEHKKNTSLLDDVEKKINEKIIYLEQLEEEWRHVKGQINDKEIVLGQKEMEIKSSTEALKQLINEKAMLKSKINRKSSKKGIR